MMALHNHEVDEWLREALSLRVVKKQPLPIDASPLMPQPLSYQYDMSRYMNDSAPLSPPLPMVRRVPVVKRKVKESTPEIEVAPTIQKRKRMKTDSSDDSDSGGRKSVARGKLERDLSNEFEMIFKRLPIRIGESIEYSTPPPEAPVNHEYNTHRRAIYDHTKQMISWYVHEWLILEQKYPAQCAIELPLLKSSRIFEEEVAKQTSG